MSITQRRERRGKTDLKPVKGKGKKKKELSSSSGDDNDDDGIPPTVG